MDRHAAIHAIRNRLRDGGTSVGSWMQIPNASVAEIMGQAGYDWVALDMEHGAISLHQLPDLCRALELGGTLPLVRLANRQPEGCAQVLDSGVGGVIVPSVESSEQLLRIRDACRWPPAGKRGVGFSRANLFGQRFDTYRQEAQAPLLVAMIEHVAALEQLPEIVAVEGLDAILIGPYDLSASLDCTGAFSDPRFISTMAAIQDIASGGGVACGIHVVTPSPEELRTRQTSGYRFLAYSIDSVIIRLGATRPQQ